MSREHKRNFENSFMSNALQISRDLWQLKMAMVNAYLLQTEDGLVLVDAGWPNKTDLIFKAVHDSGYDPKPSGIWFSRTVILTIQAVRPKCSDARAHVHMPITLIST